MRLSSRCLNNHDNVPNKPNLFRWKAGRWGKIHPNAYPLSREP
jgi:hypothetical protein